jgi:ketosteroid isomerase-like protein
MMLEHRNMNRAALYRWRRRRPLLAVLLTAALACFVPSISAARVGAARESIRAQVNRVDQAYHRAVGRRDLNAVVSLYAPNGNIIASGVPPVQGRAAVRRFLAPVFSAGWCRFTFTPSVVSASGSLVSAFGHYVSADCIRGRVVPDPKKLAVLLFTYRRGGGLQIAYDIFIS